MIARSVRALLLMFLVLPLFSISVLAQGRRISGQVDRRRLVRLTGNIHPSARPQFDVGLVDASLQMNHVTLLLKRSQTQQDELEQLLADQQDPFSPQYHHWLIPEEYADRFGANPDAIDKTVSWLQSEGFTVDEVARGRNWISFSGTAGQVQNALHTELRQYRVDGELHLANSTEPSVPAALANIVDGFAGLNDFRPKTAHLKLVAPGSAKPAATPEITMGSSHYLAPDDFALIYDINPMYRAGWDGSGQKIVVAGQTEIDLADIRSFRGKYNLPQIDPQLILVPGSASPGVTDDVSEADLDVEWAGAVARNATILYVYSTDVVRSVQYAVNHNLAPVISFSYVICETESTAADRSSLRAMAQQANAQGITWVAASGDSGAAGCDPQGARPFAFRGLRVTLPGSLPEVTGIGGTQFNEGNGSYWSATNTASGGSALSYIPEMAWNESDQNGLASTGGGLSALFPKPAWQTGSEFPTGNARGVPDVSLSASAHDGYTIFSGGRLLVVGGTSAATPAFAGLLTLLNQYLTANQFQTTPGLGNINPNLYRVAQTSSGAFHDITSGNNIVPCAAFACTDGSFGYNAAPGYDLATGLGSVDAFNLVTQWNSSAVNTVITLTASPASFPASSSTRVTATVNAVASAGIPTGTVTFYLGSVSLGAAALVNSGGNATATIMILGSQLSVGSNLIAAQYNGNASFNGSAGSVSITVNQPGTASAVLPTINPNPVFQRQPDADGNSWFYTITLTETAGSAATLNDLTINGTSYAGQIASYFGGATIPASGKLSGNFKSKSLPVPTTVVFRFSGTDAAGRQWSQQISVPFYGRQSQFEKQPISKAPSQ